MAADRTRDLKVVAAWAERWPNANVAICSDENFVILESDNKPTFRKYIKELTGHELPKTLTSGARPNRPHWIYRRGAVPLGVKNYSADGVFELQARPTITLSGRVRSIPKGAYIKYGKTVPLLYSQDGSSTSWKRCTRQNWGRETPRPLLSLRAVPLRSSPLFWKRRILATTKR